MERRGFEDPACGVKRVSVKLVRKGTKKNKHNLHACEWWWVWGLREGCDSGVVACVLVDRVVWSSLLHMLWWWSPCNGGRCGNGLSKMTLKEEKVK